MPGHDPVTTAYRQAFAQFMWKARSENRVCPQVCSLPLCITCTRSKIELRNCARRGTVYTGAPLFRTRPLSPSSQRGCSPRHSSCPSRSAASSDQGPPPGEDRRSSRLRGRARKGIGGPRRRRSVARKLAHRRADHHHQHRESRDPRAPTGAREDAVCASMDRSSDWNLHIDLRDPTVECLVPLG